MDAKTVTLDQQTRAVTNMPVVTHGIAPSAHSTINSNDRSPQRPANSILTIVPWQTAVVMIAFGAMASMFAWNVFGLWLTYRLLQSAHPASSELQRHFATITTSDTSVRLMVCDQVRGALVLGVWRPTVLIPPGQMPQPICPSLTAALRHEWAHITHGDLRWLVVERIVATVFAAQPLLIVLRRALRLDQELVADAAAAGEHPVEYAEALLTWVKSIGNESLSPAVAGFSSGRHYQTVLRRLTMLLDSPRLASQPVSWRYRVSVSLLLSAAVASVSLLTLRSTQSTAEEPPAAKPAPMAVRPTPIAPPRPSPEKPAEASSSTQAQVKLEIVALLLDREKLKNTDESLPDWIVDASEERCRLEGQVIVAPVRTPRFHDLLKKLESRRMSTVISRPRIVTTLDKPASMFVGAETPLVEVREFDGVKGEFLPPQMEFGPTGLRMDVTVSQPVESSLFQVELLGKYSTLSPPKSTTNPTRVLDTYRVHLTNELSLGETLVLLNRDDPRSDKKRPSGTPRPDLFFAVTLLE
jgi:beta-lactamase regulating signal transducer with metallopeptidase domain